MPPRHTISRLANLSAEAIYQAFCTYDAAFRDVTRRAKASFEEQDWKGMQADASKRLALYREAVGPAVENVRGLLEERTYDKIVWTSIKAVYSGRIAGLDDWEIAETFFNSVTRRIFATVGVDQQIEFVDTDYATPPTPPPAEAIYRTYRGVEDTEELVRRILCDYGFEAPFQDLERDARAVAERIEAHLQRAGSLRTAERVEMIESIFFRGKGAYLVGRFFSGAHLIPLVLAVHHPDEGLVVDAVLFEENDISILFGFTRSYFHVEADRPYDLVRFLKTIIPRKRTAEIYIAIGYNKHGKTELYRDLRHHLAYSDDRFEIARGKRGMVMSVFTMPNYDVVFKVIKDHFDHPKDTTRQAVKDKYSLVFKHDRAGRLIDAQEFEHLKFERWRLVDELLEELREVAGRTVHVDEDHVVLEHCYVERRVIPLDIYIREATPEAAEAAVIDYGCAIKDLAKTNIFPGDLFLKNFGVTRHGRVIFYDYDELTMLTECNFREMPEAQSYEQEMASEPWFYVNEADVFPEEFRHFLGLPRELREVFQEHHDDLFDVAFWRDMQERVRAGGIMHFIPYDDRTRLEGAPEVV